jgi:hypothetical protein
MTIFNIEINGKDAEWFCSLTKSEKYNWVIANTNQTNETMINEFLSRTLDPNKKEHCIGCRNKKEKVSISKIVENGNISKGDEQTIETVIEPTAFKKSRKHRDNK